jgi:hypothetical protein
MATALAKAIERKDWQFVALCLLAGLVDELTRLPPETLERMLELLEVPDRDRRIN